MKKVTRQSSCGPLGLSPDLACNHCIPSVNKSFMKGIVPTQIKKCSQPWLPKWTHHREIEKVRVHKKVIKYLGEIDVDSDELVDVSISDKEVLCKYFRVTSSIEDNMSSGINDATIANLNYTTR